MKPVYFHVVGVSSGMDCPTIQLTVMDSRGFIHGSHPPPSPSLSVSHSHGIFMSVWCNIVG